MKKWIKISIVLIFLFFVILSCSDKVGTYAGMREDFLRIDKVKEYQIRPKTGKKIIFKINHENNIDLRNYDVLIYEINDYHYYYHYGPYQKEISVYIPNSIKEYHASMVFAIIDKKTDSVYDFKSNLTYFLLEAKSPIKVKLLDTYKKFKGEEINYKLIGCSNEVRK